jgi:hypothetical protein
MPQQPGATLVLSSEVAVNVPEFRPASALETLLEHRVRFVLIGGLAANLHGSPSVTEDLDICYARDRKNLESLSAALLELRARLRGAPSDVPFLLDAATLEAGDHFTFDTDAGSLDILGTPAGTSGFDALNVNAVEMHFDLMSVKVASIDDLMRMKRAAGRPKDRIELEILGALQDELEGR